MGRDTILPVRSGYEDIYESTINKIDSSAKVHHNVIMGKGNVICEGVIIREGVQLGDGNFIGPYCVIGDYPEKHGYFDKLGKVLIGSNNRFTKFVTVDSSTDGVTIIKDNCILLRNSHLGHEAKLENNVIISCNAIVAGHTEVGEFTNLGLGAVTHQRLKIPDHCMIGMNTTVTKKTVLRPGRKYIGSPARDIGPNER